MKIVKLIFRLIIYIAAKLVHHSHTPAFHLTPLTHLPLIHDRTNSFHTPKNLFLHHTMDIITHVSLSKPKLATGPIDQRPL